MAVEGRFVGPCYKCRTEMWLPLALYDACKHSIKHSFFCPYGHEQIFADGESQETILRRERDRLTQQMAQKNDEIRELTSLLANERIALNRERAALKKVHTRVGHGVCPCCNRSFVQLQRHMKTKHPEFKAVA